MRQVTIRSQTLVMVGSALFGALLGVALVRLSGAGFQGDVPAPAAILLAIVLYLACILVHEAGHLAGGALAGFRPLVLIAGPLRLERTNGRTRASLNRSIPLAGGLAICTPVGTLDLRRRTMVMAAGGPIASLILGVQCLALWMALSPVLRDGGAAASIVTFILLFGGFVSLAIGILTLLPMSANGFYSDGARILRLMRNNEDTEREVALMSLMGLALGGTRPRDWDVELVRSASAIRDGGAFEVSGLHFAHLHALDRGDIDRARSCLEEMLTRVHQLPAVGRGPLLLGAAVFFALYDGDAVRARSLYEAAGSGAGLLRSPHQRLLADAAVRLAEGDVHGAADAAAAAQDMMQRAADRASTAVDAAHAARILSAAVAAPGNRE